MSAASETPLMQQYREIKDRHQNAILFFRMGEFYEMFYDDAETASRVLGLTLTSRNNGGASEVPLAGVPVKAAGDYVRRLVQQGFRVAICEQVEDPKVAKGVVRREVIETVTPGVAFSDDLLDGARNNFICGIVAGDGAASGKREVGGGSDGMVGVAAADVSTGEVRLISVVASELDALLARLSPREILIPTASRFSASCVSRRSSPSAKAGSSTSRSRATISRDSTACCRSMDSASTVPTRLAVRAAGALLRYLRELQPSGLRQLARPSVERPGGVMPLDEMTRRNLELVESLRGGVEGTLLSVLDRTSTPMGARLLRQWVLAPLTDRGAIEARHAAVAAFSGAVDGTQRSCATRSTTFATSNDSPPRRRPGAACRASSVHWAIRCRRCPPSRTRSTESPSTAAWLRSSARGTTPRSLRRELTTALVERPPMAIGDEPTIATGVDVALDALREIRDGGKDAIARIQSDERTRTGISSLKVGFNKVFGYYIEVTRSNLHLVPPDYQRRQTITSGERFVTPALKEYEERVLTAAERIETRERELFEQLRRARGATRSRDCKRSRA